MEPATASGDYRLRDGRTGHVAAILAGRSRTCACRPGFARFVHLHRFIGEGPGGSRAASAGSSAASRRPSERSSQAARSR